ncbi:transport and Golgi organization protein 2 [Galleria mellonella]|uniref:Transport and Golgi organization protein 2 n=1 Tax=Galleria mellonella TaxID=7137 RepID=A0A6J3BSL9_GALME|nr:transport and Golgi organization protein 2 [Galleria mellonella]XP_031764331.2 transport and Golgi organization protein 2 [Galleria mellonella]XP_031764332.2 transport and Golgi organization protein 2 [Galleria mellonella]XP_031764333.2 transport and Golgi organization protein 2 [Galleria mellonella]XP_052752090.1 transport and Golgi organization protein 2 [Galleria mellonella]XP_052752091.1 transport and Golgi organization protein 2 [Galleria mellonella]
MCILFTYNGVVDEDSDYSFILASNRDEFYDRPADKMAVWSDDPNVVAGRDLEAGGTWLAVSPLRKKIGVLLNLPGSTKLNSQSRGKVVSDYIKCEAPTKEYIESTKSYFKECNDFLFVTVEDFVKSPLIQAYNNSTCTLTEHRSKCEGFGNCLPRTPLKKVEGGKNVMQEICNKFNKLTMKDELVNELIKFLKSDQRHLPDQLLEKRRPDSYKELSSIFVSIPRGRYGTRTHTLVLVTKSGKMDIVEIDLKSSDDLLNPEWETTKFQYSL